MTAQELKNSVLQLAVQGKLVPQCKDDEPASELLKRIRAVKEKAVKKEKPLPAIAEDEIPFDIPENWEWARLNDISSITSGGTPARTNSSFWNGNIPWVKIGDIRNKYISTTEEKISEQGLNSSSAKIFPKGTILYTIFATIGTVGILNIDAATNQAVAGVTFFGEYSRDYMYYVLIGLKDILVSKGKGMAQMNINLTILKNTPIPIPPLAEQKRIVEKIEELMPLIEEYGKAEDQLSKLNAEFPDKLRKSILRQAVQGRLVSQDPNDEPASELLKRICAEKSKMIAEGKNKKGNPVLEIDEDEIPFEIPESWVWVRFLSVVDIKANLVSPSEYLKYLHIAPDNIEKSTGRLLECRTVEEDKVASANHLFFEGQIIYSKIRPLLRKAVIAPFKGLCSADMYPLDTYLDKKYVLYYLLSDACNKQISKIIANRVKMPKINQNELSQVLFPLPPLAEQKRIVKRVEELLALCDGLK